MESLGLDLRLRLRATILLVVLGSLSARSASAVGYLPAGNAAVPPSGSEVLSGDGDGDGFDDLAVALPLRPSVGLLWNQGQTVAAFDAVVEVAMPIAPVKLAFADLNGDGRADLVAVGNAGERRLVVRLAQAGRTFGSASVWMLPAGAVSGLRYLVAADVDDDGDRDLVVAEQESFVVLRNRGAGDFDPPRVDGRPGGALWRLGSADLGGGAGVDFLLSRDTTIEAWLNDGSGRFTARPGLDVGIATRDVSVLDLDGDGWHDVVSAEPGQLRLFRNDGSGQLSAGSVLADPSTLPVSRVLDLNADGISDLVRGDLGGSLAVFYGDGVGGLAGPVARTLGNAPNYLTLGDFNRDGDANDIAALASDGQIAIRISASTARVPAPWARYPVGSEPRALAIADFDGDGRADVMAANAGARDCHLLRGTGGGTLAVAARAETEAYPLLVSASDVDGDGLRDLVVLSSVQKPREPASGPPADARLEFLRNLGSGAFDRPATLAAGQGPTGLALGDLDGDGREDVVVASKSASELLLFRNTGNGFVLASKLAAGQGPVGVVAADFDDDGDLDLACAMPGEVQVFENQGLSGAWPAQTLAAGQGPVGIAAPDLDLDGRADLVVLDGDAGALEMLVSTGGLAFAKTGVTPVPGRALALATGDLNCDAAEDLLVASDTGDDGGLLVALSEGDGRVAPVQSLAAGQGPSGVAVGDLDGSGAEDPVVVIGAEDELRVGLNLACAESACSTDAPGFGVLSRGCAGGTVRLSGPEGYSRYRWSNGDERREIVLPLLAPGTDTITLRVADENGCGSSGDFSLLVDPSPEVRVIADRRYACAGSETELRFSLLAVDGWGLPAQAERLSWEVEAPGWLSESEGPSATVVVPPATLIGSFRVIVTAGGTYGCERVASTWLHLVKDETATEPVGNSLELARNAAAGIEIRWLRSPALVHTLWRYPGKNPGTAAGSAIGVGLEAASITDAPPPGSWYYRVEPGQVCASNELL